MREEIFEGPKHLNKELFLYIQGLISAEDSFINLKIYRNSNRHLFRYDVSDICRYTSNTHTRLTQVQGARVLTGMLACPSVTGSDPVSGNALPSKSGPVQTSEFRRICFFRDVRVTNFMPRY